MTKSVAISLIYVLVFVGFNCIGFSLKWWRFAQEVDLVTWLANGATCESHMKSTCWKLKSQVSGCISRVILRLRLGHEVTRETLCLDDFKCDSYTLHPYYIYHYYLQKCIESIHKKTLEKFLQHTHLVRESYSSSIEKSL